MLLLTSLTHCQSKLNPWVTGGNKKTVADAEIVDAASVSTPDAANTPEIFPTDPNKILNTTVSNSTEADVKFAVSSRDIVGPDLIFSGKIFDKNAVAVLVDVIGVDGAGNKTCFHQDIGLFSQCPGNARASIGADGIWIVAVPKNLFFDNLKYQIEVSAVDVNGVAFGTIGFSFKWDASPAESNSTGPNPTSNASEDPEASDSSSPSPSVSASPASSPTPTVSPSVVPTPTPSPGPIFTSLDLGALAFDDGIIDRVEARAGSYLTSNLNASGYQDVGYLIVDATQNCSSFTSVYYRPEIPVTSSTYAYPGGNYKVCVRLVAVDGFVSYGESADFTRETSAPLSDPHTVKQLASYNHRTCAILNDNSLKCWGNNTYGALGLGDTTDRGQTPGSMAALPSVNLGSGRTALVVTVGSDHTCALLDNHTIKCWGRSTSGALGIDTISASTMASLPIVNLGAGRTATTVSSGWGHVCAVLDDGSMKCWGYNSNGQLGLDDNVNRGSSTGNMAALPFVNLGAGRSAKTVSAGFTHTCAVLDDDTVKCWGTNNDGQLGFGASAHMGDGSGEMAALPIASLGASRTAKAISSGGAHSCAILDNDAVRCWGANYNGQIGTDNINAYGMGNPNLGSGRTAVSLSVGENSTCVILDTGAAKCWGANSYGALGKNDLEYYGATAGSMATLTTINIGAGRTFKSIITGDTTCAVLDNDSAKCWGYNSSGELGQDDALNRGGSPTSMATLPAINVGAGRTVKQIASGSKHSCAILDNDAVKCWGYNPYGQLGVGDGVSRGKVAGDMAALPAVNLGVGRTARNIAVGTTHTCSVLDNNTVKCWGQGGGLGLNDLVARGDTAGAMTTLPTVFLGAGRVAKEVSAGGNFSCALLDDNSVKCWGGNTSGQLGQDDTNARGWAAGDMNALQPINLGAGRTAKAVRCGYAYVCAILDNDLLKCWGANGIGGLGLDDTVMRGDDAGEMAALPTVNLGAGRTAKSVAPGTLSTCAILDNDSLKCWGGNSNGQLGLDDRVVRGASANSMANLPTVNLGMGRTAKAVTKTGDSTCAILDNDTVKCWGKNSDGRLGTEDIRFWGTTNGDMAALPTINFGMGRKAQSISGGENHVCAILTDGTARCWGEAFDGQLGLDSTIRRGNSLPLSSAHEIYFP